MNNNVHQHLHSPNKLTEFARGFEEESETLFGKFVNKIQNAYNHSYNTVNDVSSVSQVQVAKSVFYADVKVPDGTISRDSSSSSISSNRQQPPKTLNLHTNSESRSSNSITTTEDSLEANEKVEELPIEPNEGRTMVNVLKRISNLVASKNDDLRNYKDTDLQRFWMPDSKAKECYDCSQKFSTFRRKHHCRLCGQIFCSKCCNQVVPGKIIMCAGDLKVCNYCSKIVLSYLKSSNITVDLHADLQALQQDLSSKLEISENAASSSLRPTHNQNLTRKASLGYQEERFASQQAHSLSFDDRKNILQQSNSLITLHEEMQRVLPPQNCGLSLIEFLNTNNKSSNKVQAVAILSAMLAAGFLQPIVPDTEQTEFDENLHYKFAGLVRQSNNTYILDNLPEIPDAISPQLSSSNSDPQPPKLIDAISSLQSPQDFEVEPSIRATSAISQLLESYCDHEEQLLTQLLRSYQLNLQWAKVLEPLCCGAANHFKPENCTNELMDIRNYVNFKKVPGGKRTECTIVGGVVFSKNVAHKDMATRVDCPKILLLQCPIVYERIEGKFVTISTVLLQEKEYLRNVCARIMSFKPNVVLVHKNVAGLAQDMLRSHGVTLVLDVKLSVMERLSRTLQCDILTSIESNITRPTLGLCDAFYIRNFNDGTGSYKTLMYFEKLKNPRGYTCLLRGGNSNELAKVKKVASFLVYARYNWRLEMSFLLDQFAQPLTPKPPIFDSKESSPKSESNVLPKSTQSSDTDDEEQTQLRCNVKPPTKRTFGDRKSEDKILAAVCENVSDFTDPLRSTKLTTQPLSPSDQPIVAPLAVETPYDNRFRNALSSTLLSVSPFLTFPLPYLETEQGRKCKLRKLFPPELYFSKLWSRDANTLEKHESIETIKACANAKIDSEKELLPPHPFLKLKITTPITNRDIQTLLAEFRSFGGRYPKRKKMLKPKKQRNSFQRPQKVNDGHVFKDALDLENHQRLPVLFCSFYLNPKSASSFCTPPMTLDMKFYGQQDIMLGQFLQRYCCLLTSICPSCKLPMLGHVRRYVHSMGCVQVYLTEDNTRTDPNRIYFTSWCSICNEVTPTVPLSEASKCLSFAKYLEMRFHGHAYKKRKLDDSISKCEHSINRDYIHYFSYRGVGARFQYTAIEVWEIGLPALVLSLHPPKPFNHFEVLEEIKNFSMRGHEVYTRIHERIADLATEDENSPLVVDLKTTLSKDQFIFKQKIEIIQMLLTESKANSYDINDALVFAKRALAESLDVWDPRLHEIAMAQKLAAKQAHHVDAGTICTEELRPEQNEHMSSAMTDAQRSCPLQMDNQGTTISDSANEEVDTPSSAHSIVEKKFSIEQLLSSTVNSDKKSIKKMLTQLLPSTGHVNLLQSPFSAQEHLTLPLGAFPILVRDNDLSSIIAYSLTSYEYQRLVAGNNSTQHTSEVASTDSTNQSPQLKRKPLESETAEITTASRTAATSSVASGNNTAGNVASTDSEERLKPKTHNSHVEVTFQDNGSQFTCKIYFAREFDTLRASSLKAPKLDNSMYKILEKSKMLEELKISQSKSGPEIELIRKPSDACNAAGTQQIDVQKKKDEHFDIEECRNIFARSLCSSVQWEARGGKSGSRFCKTIDDRFVLKEMTKGDVNIFENFAPNYFDYIHKCQQQIQPTLLAKIFGVFKVTIKKKDQSVEKSVLVMENLFYDSDIKNKFDLKGSERNRLVDPTNQNGEIVLLDENLVQMSWSKPLYILSHSKAVLKEAINRDACFLEKNEVMDYSLLVGLDNSNSVLVLGIIDYIRTYTFDKKFESFVKQTGILGGMGKLPTVISPERYKQRFIDAMDRYFYIVPDRWEGLSKI